MDILYPLFTEVALTFTLLALTGLTRVKAVNGRKVHPRDIALREPNWPSRPTQMANAFQNQLETPVLFYLLVILLLITEKVTDGLIILAWAWVAARIVHAIIHTTYNNVTHRFFAFLASVVILGIMWGLFFMGWSA